MGRDSLLVHPSTTRSEFGIVPFTQETGAHCLFRVDHCDDYRTIRFGGSAGLRARASVSQAFRLILYLIAVHRIFPDRAAELYSYAVTVTAEEPPLFAGEYGRLKTLLLLIELAGRESGGKK